MMKYLFAALLVFAGGSLFAQNTTFTPEDDKQILHKGDVVTVTADTAYLYSTARVRRIQTRLDTITKMYNGLLDNRNELLDEMKETHKVLEDLEKKMREDSTFFNTHIESILTNLDGALDDLEASNDELKNKNADLKKQAEHMKKLVKDLQSEMRGIWWNGITDKIVAFAGGLGVGILVGAIFL